MANILTAAAEAASRRTTSSVRDVKNAAMNQFDPRKSVYGLGLGIGPLIKQTVSEYKKQQSASDTKEAKKSQRELVDIKSSSQKNTKTLNRAVTQLSNMNNVLNEIRKINMAQLQAHTQTMKASRRMSALGANAAANKSQSSFSGIAESAGSVSRTEGSALGDLMSSDTGSLLKVALGGLALGELWKVLPDNIKKDVKSAGKGIGEAMVDSVGGVLKQAFEAAPVATAIGTLLVAKVSGLLDLAMISARVGISASKGAYNVGKVLTGAWAPEAGLSATGAAGAAKSAQAPGVGNAVRRMVGKEQQLVGQFGEEGVRKVPLSEAAREYKETAKYSSPTYANESFAKTYGEKGLQAIKDAATPTATAAGSTSAAATEAQAAAETARATGKIASGFATATKWLSKGLGVLGVGASAWSAKENFQKGNNVLGTLDTVSAATGALALGAAATGIGAPVAAALGGISLMTGLASTAGSFFTGNDAKAEGPKSQPQQQMASTGSSALARNAQKEIEAMYKGKAIPSQQDVMKIIHDVFAERGFTDVQIKAAQTVAAAESGLNPTAVGDNGASVGLFQLNRLKGEGRGYSIDQLADAATNAQITADKMSTKQGNAFRNAKTVDEAVLALTRDFERPSFVKGNAIADMGAFQKYASRGANITGNALDVSQLQAAASGSGSLSGVSSGGIDVASLKSAGLSTTQIESIQSSQEYIKGFNDLGATITNLLAGGGIAGGQAPAAAATPNGANKAPPTNNPGSPAKADLAMYLAHGGD